MLEFRSFFNSKKGQPAIILGHGPSLNDISDRLLEFHDKGYVLFGTNEWFNVYRVFPDCKRIWDTAIASVALNTSTNTGMAAEAQICALLDKVDSEVQIGFGVIGDRIQSTTREIRRKLRHA